MIGGPSEKEHESAESWIIVAILLLGLLLRLPFAAREFRTTSDVETYRRWARTIRQQGLETIYAGTDVDYPPLILYLLGGAAKVEAQLPFREPAAADRALTALIKLPAIIADILTAAVILRALRGQKPAIRVLACASYTFHPAIWYVSAHWGQTDSIYTLFLVASMVALERGRLPFAWAAYTLALGTKLQSIAVTPLILVVTWKRHGLRGLAGGLVASVITGTILLTPWWFTGHLGDVLRPYITLPDQSPRLVVSAYNLWYLLRLGRVHLVSSAGQPGVLPFSYQTLGILMFWAFVVLVAGLMLSRRRTSLFVAAAVLSLGLFMLLTQMHERYMFPVLAFLLLAAGSQVCPSLDGVEIRFPGVPGFPGRWFTRKTGLWWAYGVLSLTFLYNLVTIASPVPALWTNLVAPQPDSSLVLALRGIAVLVAAANTATLVGLIAWLAGRVAPLGRSTGVCPLTTGVQ